MKRQDLAGVLTDRHRHVITAVVEEVSAQAPEQSLALKLLPPTNVPAAILEHEIISASGGKTGERKMGAPGKAVSGPSSTSKVYKPGSYQEFIKFSENDLVKLRKLGTIGDRGVTGLTGGELDWMERAADKLKKRLVNRLAQLAWDAIFTGQYVYQGIIYDFAVPAGNQLASATDWSAAGSKPFEDLVALCGQSDILRKYRNLIKGFVINPKTEADIIQRALAAGYITNNNIMAGGINVVKKFAAPGLPDFIVCDDVVQDETENADGSVSVGTAEFLVPDDKVLVLIDFDKARVQFPEYGQLQLAENMNDPSATVAQPAVGVYTFVDEKGLDNRKAPYVEIVSGFNGGPNLHRSNDVIVISV